MSRASIHLGLFFLAACVQAVTASAGAAASKPNILYIVADDFGYADAGFSGGKIIATPTLDKLAREGAILDAFYVQPVCSPTRAALMTGRYAVHTGVYTIVPPGAPGVCRWPNARWQAPCRNPATRLPSAASGISASFSPSTAPPVAASTTNMANGSEQSITSRTSAIRRSTGIATTSPVRTKAIPRTCWPRKPAE